MNEDYVVRYGNSKSVNRSDYDTKENCEKFIKKLEKNKNVTWFELVYEPIEEEDVEEIVKSGEKLVIEVFGKEAIEHVWR